MNYLENEFFLLAITFGIYFFAKLLQKKTGILLLNPILLTIAVIIIFLKLTNISFETFNQVSALIVSFEGDICQFKENDDDCNSQQDGIE